jgi:hypothetical protein
MWLKNTTSVLLTAIVMNSACVGCIFSIKEKKLSPFVRMKSCRIENDIKTELIVGYDFVNQLISASLEVEEAKLLGEIIK